MKKIRLGKTELMVGASSFGALPVQRLSTEDACKLLRKAYELGMNYFDTAHSYTDSEEKIGLALSDVRKDIIISTKSPAKDKKTLLEQVQMSLERMKTDYIDILQLHNPDVLPDPEDPDSRAVYYDADGNEITLNQGRTWVCIIQDSYEDNIVIE